MPRVRGPAPNRPEGETAWPLLNERVFGAVDRGGNHTLPLPEAHELDLAAIFGRAAPVTYEIGFNRGRFLRALAARWPDHDHLGVEIRRRYAWKVCQEMAGAGGPRNVRLLWADAKLVGPCFAPGRFAHVFINFPDPWWKRRHARRRLVDTDFASDLAARLAPGGSVWVKSDVPAIADEIAAGLRACGSFDAEVEFSAEDLPPSYRESRCLKAGLPITRFRATRRPG